MNLLVTGGMGFVGSNVARYFIDAGHKVSLFDIRPRELGHLEEVRNSWRYLRGSITDLELLDDTIKKEKPEAIFHAVGGEFGNAYRHFEVHVTGTANILEAARRHDLYTVALSSGAIYGQLDGHGPVAESEPFGPIHPPREYDSASGSAYAASKRLAEQWMQLYRDLYGLRVACPRLVWVYGPGSEDYQLQGGPSLMLRKAIAGESLQVPYGGDTLCNLVYVKDVCDAIFKCVASGKSLTFNVSYEKGYYMKEVAAAVMKTIPGAKIELGPGIWPSKGVSIPRHGISMPTNRHTDISLAKKQIGYHPVYDIDRGVREYADWMKRNWNLCSPKAVPFVT
jgi:nucleoside-diphosphate-sugar epimerase